MTYLICELLQSTVCEKSATISGFKIVSNCSVEDKRVASSPVVSVCLFPVSQQRRCRLAWTCRKHQHRGNEKSVRDQFLWRGPHDQRSDA